MLRDGEQKGWSGADVEQQRSCDGVRNVRALFGGRRLVLAIFRAFQRSATTLQQSVLTCTAVTDRRFQTQLNSDLNIVGNATNDSYWTPPLITIAPTMGRPFSRDTLSAIPRWLSSECSVVRY